MAAVDFSTWANGRSHRMVWTPDEARENAIRSIREALSEPAAVEVRVAGRPGVGKSRLVLEALRDETVVPLVAYIADGHKMSGGLLGHLVSGGRKVVLVIDECPADRHSRIAGQLPDDPRIKLITIGPVGAAATRDPVHLVEPMPSNTVDALLSSNFPVLPRQARQVVVRLANGIPRDANTMARRVRGSGNTYQAADLVTEINLIAEDLLLRFAGSTLLVAEGVALFEQLGWDGELATERDQLPEFLGVSASEIQAAGIELEQAGWLTVRGRYRVIEPHPLAVHLAARRWQAQGPRIVNEFLDKLSQRMADSLFRRLADLGRIETARDALRLLLAADGPFGSLDAIRTRGTGSLLTQLAILLPGELAIHVSELIEGADNDELRDHRTIRRDLVWTLAKLAWHTDTFELAADALLRLALVENERYANNATGTWTDLFGTILPTTAASPKMRMTYLRRFVGSQDVRERALAVSALERALRVRETAATSAQSQGGVPVERPGTPSTWDEAWEYQIDAINELGRLASDDDPGVRSAAACSFVRAINPLAGSGRRWDALVNVLARTPTLHREVRHKLQELGAVYQESSVFNDSPERREKRRVMSEAASALAARLPAPDTHESLIVALGEEHPWGGQDRQLASIVDAITRFLGDHREAELLALLMQRWPAARAFGAALASVKLQQDLAVKALTMAYRVNPAALQSYLRKKTEQGDPQAVEAFLDTQDGRSLSDTARLEIASIDESSHRVSGIVEQLAKRLPVAEAVRRVPPTSVSLPRLLEDWSARIETQDDYNALIDWLALAVPHQGAIDNAISETVLVLVLRRREFPNVRSAAWDWAQLSKAVLRGNEEEIATLVLDLIDHSDLLIMADGEEARLLTVALQQRTHTVWELIADRLQAGSWSIEMSVREWLLTEIDTTPVQEWIGDDIGRARIVARITHPGTDQPTPLARYLLDRVSDDEEVTTCLYTNLITGSWTEKESDRIQRQIEQLNSWRQNPTEPLDVRQWAAKATDCLAASRQSALQREAEHYL